MSLEICATKEDESKLDKWLSIHCTLIQALFYYIQPGKWKKSFGDRAFSVAASTLWNALLGKPAQYWLYFNF